jgi:hypothetical protein
MTKVNTTSSTTRSHATPVKANTGKLIVKNKFLHVREEPLVTPPKQPSPLSVLTATTASSILANQESLPSSLLTASTVTTASLILLSQSSTTTTTNQSNSSILVRDLDFSNLPITAKKEPNLINFCDPFDVKTECLKYLADANDLPVDQESQLAFLLNNLKVQDIQMAFIKLFIIVGGFATTSFFLMP